MWMSCVASVLLSMTANQSGELSIVNDRLTHGHLGPVRESAKYLPGDVIHLSFELQHMTFDGDGKASYAMSLDVLDGKGEPIIKQKPVNAVARNYLGGSTLPCTAHLQVPLQAPAGGYTMRVTMIDNASKKSVTLDRKVEVLPKGFGLVHVGTSADVAGNLAWSPVGVVGDSIYLNFSAVGFERDKTTKKPHIKVSMRVLDNRGQPTGGAKLEGEAKDDVPDNVSLVPMQFGITLNRQGPFTLELTATDMLTGTTAKVSFPVRVLAP